MVLLALARTRANCFNRRTWRRPTAFHGENKSLETVTTKNLCCKAKQTKSLNRRERSNRKTGTTIEKQLPLRQARAPFGPGSHPRFTPGSGRFTMVHCSVATKTHAKSYVFLYISAMEPPGSVCNRFPLYNIKGENRGCFRRPLLSEVFTGREQTILEF